MTEMTKEEAARFLRDFERDHPGETKRILETLWDLQGGAPGTWVTLDQLVDELNRRSRSARRPGGGTE